MRMQRREKSEGKTGQFQVFTIIRPSCDIAGGRHASRLPPSTVRYLWKFGISPKILAFQFFSFKRAPLHCEPTSEAPGWKPVRKFFEILKIHIRACIL